MLPANPYQTPLSDSQLPVYKPRAPVWKWRFFLALKILGASFAIMVFCVVSGWMFLENELPDIWFAVLGVPVMASYISLLLSGVLALISGMLWLIYYVAERSLKNPIGGEIGEIGNTPHQRESSNA